MAVTTPRDLALLAFKTMHDFPGFYPYFAARSMTFRGQELRGINKFTAGYPGAEGMKTGFTCGSGYNLISSAQQNSKHLIGVIMGGMTSPERYQLMTAMMDAGFSNNLPAHSDRHVSAVSGRFAGTPPHQLNCGRMSQNTAYAEYTPPPARAAQPARAYARPAVSGHLVRHAPPRHGRHRPAARPAASPTAPFCTLSPKPVSARGQSPKAPPPLMAGLRAAPAPLGWCAYHPNQAPLSRMNRPLLTARQLLRLLRLLCRYPKLFLLGMLLLGGCNYVYEVKVARPPLLYQGEPKATQAGSGTWFRVLRNHGFILGYSDLRGNPLWVDTRCPRCPRMRQGSSAPTISAPIGAAPTASAMRVTSKAAMTAGIWRPTMQWGICTANKGRRIRF